MTYIMRFDGLYRRFQDERRPNDTAGLLCFGWLIYRNEVVIAQGHGVFARNKGASSNVAEYVALVEGLDAMGDLGLEDQSIKVFGDAKSVIDQMVGIASVSSETIWPLYMHARQLANHFPNINWGWTPRRFNKAADSLTRRAMRQIHSDQRTYQTALKAAKNDSGRWRQSAKLLPLIDLRIYQPAYQVGLVSGNPSFLPVF